MGIPEFTLSCHTYSTVLMLSSRPQCRTAIGDQGGKEDIAWKPHQMGLWSRCFVNFFIFLGFQLFFIFFGFQP